MGSGPLERRLAAALAAWAVLGVGAGAAQTRTDSTVAVSTPTPTESQPTPESLALAQDTTLRLTLPVMVNGQGPFGFLVDTGSDRTVISRELAATLALPDGPSVRMQQSMGVDQVKTVVIDHLAIGSRMIDHIEAPALSAANLGAAGMLGVDSLRDLHVVMDFGAMRLSSSPSRAEPLDAQTIVVRGRSRYGELILSNSTIHGVKVLVVLDSGSEVSIGNPALLKLLTGHALGNDKRMTTEIVGVTGRKMTVEMDLIGEAYVGGVIIRNMPLAFAQLHIFDHFGLTRQPTLLLGMDVLSLCKRVSVDLRRREATFTVN